MIFNGKGTMETKLVQIDGQYIERVWKQGDKKSFKLVGTQVDEQLKWEEHITFIAKKIGYANYSLNKSHNRLNTKSQKTPLQWHDPLTSRIWSPGMGICPVMQTRWTAETAEKGSKKNTQSEFQRSHKRVLQKITNIKSSGINGTYYTLATAKVIKTVQRFCSKKKIVYFT